MGSDRILIVGAGVAGAIAYRSSPNALIHEAGPKRSCLDSHRAVMRIRDPKTALLLGCQTEKVTVFKQALWKGELTSSSSIAMNNAYSYKVSNEVSEKSILHLGREERLLLKGDITPPDETAFSSRLVGIDKLSNGGNWATFEDANGEVSGTEYDYMISTIPLWRMLGIVGFPLPGEFVSTDIWVITGQLRVSSTVNHTIYFPSPLLKTYRATIEGQKFMLEATGEPDVGEIKDVIKAFGLPATILAQLDGRNQPNGKMSRIPDAARRASIFRLTDEFNILSFGRFAIWKPIRTDHMTSDIEKIHKIIASRDEYLLQKERAK